MEGAQGGNWEQVVLHWSADPQIPRSSESGLMVERDDLHL